MRAIELFAGAGGLGMGLSAAGFNPVRVVEWDRWCCDTIRENRWMPNNPIANWPMPDEADVRSIDFREFEGKVHLVSGGPPCQPFSLGGKHRGNDDVRDMWSEAVRAVRETKPKAFVFENVKGLTRASFATYFAYIVHQLSYPELIRKPHESLFEHLSKLERHHTSGGQSSVSYKVVPRVLNAANYGVPQRRERVVFVGIREDLGIKWSFPDETHSMAALLWDQLRSGEYWEKHQVPKYQRNVDDRVRRRAEALSEQPETLPWRTVRDAIQDLPDPEREVGAGRDWLNHRFQPGARSYKGHTGSPMDEPAKTLKAGVHGVPGGENMLLRHDGTVRYFTVRESARLQTFPDNYQFHGAWSEAMRQLGNAVPVQLAQVIGHGIAERISETSI